MGICINSMGLYGMNAYPVQVEADTLRALPSFDIVGLPDASVKESRDRVRIAMKNCGYEFPATKITVNLAPADIKKSGPLYDVPILLAMLCITGQLACGDLSDSVFLGELSLDGSVRPVNGVLPMAVAARKSGAASLFVPLENAAEAALVSGLDVYGIENASQLIAHLLGHRLLTPTLPEAESDKNAGSFLDFADVKGQTAAKRALEIAAAGSHNALMIGPPGSGKSMLAKRLPSILPDMTFEESMEVTQLYSVAGLLGQGSGLVKSRPFRAPHHTVSPAGLSGGGSIPRPGEVSLAHHGVLFLDELPEFSRSAMEILRQPVEDGTVTISRASGTLSYPCSIMLIAAMNPCPCGYFGHPARPCTCTPNQVTRYLSKVSGPLLDRLDLHIDVQPVEFESLSSTQKAESSTEIKKRVDAARKIQNHRFAGSGIVSNSRIPAAKLSEFCPMDLSAQKLLKSAFEKLGLSARAYDRIMKVARTIADLDGSETISNAHIAEAIQYRSLDRKYWQR